PGAKYDASGNAGIINIRLKKNKKFGTNGSASLGLIQGKSVKGNGGINLNYRDKKVNVFGNISGADGHWENNQAIDRIQRDTLYNQLSKSISHNKGMNGKAGADFFIHKRHTLGLLVTAGVADYSWKNESTTDIFRQGNAVPDKILAARNTINGQRTNITSNINYRYADTSGLEINVDADYALYRADSKSYQPNFYKDGEGKDLYEVINRNVTPTNIDIYTIKADAEMNKWKGKLGFGVKSAYVVTENVFDIYRDIAGVPVKNLAASNSFRYVENVNAAYINFSKELHPKLSFQAGLRMEHTMSEGRLIRADGQQQDDEHIRKNYVNLFPSMAATLKMNRQHSFGLTYSRRIDRPGYRNLNPFENKLDELTYQKGNAFLKPQFGNNLEFSHVFKGKLTTTFGYNDVSDFISEYLDTTNGNATYVQQRNLARQQMLTLSVSTSFKVMRWWNVYVSAHGNHQSLQGRVVLLDIYKTINSYGSYVQNSFTLGKNYT
ncbi:MAG: TonB-dependent receptor, partial [Sphingobacteriales bacterium]